MAKFLLLITIIVGLINSFGQSGGHFIDEWSICKKEIYLLQSQSNNQFFDLNISSGIDSVQNNLISIYGLSYLENNPTLKLSIPQKIFNDEFLMDINLIHGLKKLEKDNQIKCFVKEPTPLVILINSNEDILLLGKIVHIDSVEKIVSQYLLKVGIEDGYPVTFGEAKLFIRIVEGTSQKSLNKLLQTICLGYIDFVRIKSETSLCRKSRNEIHELRQKYPLHVIVQLKIFNLPIEEIEIYKK